MPTLIRETEVSVAPLPKNVLYDASDCSAKLTFAFTQNSSANGTIDPSHIVCIFYGKDTYGNRMNHDGDEYVGTSKIV
jgi:hypothetical protein